MPDKQIILGTDIKTNQPVEISMKSRREGTYMLGRTGSGKSNEIVNLVEQDMNAGLALCVIEPKGDLIDKIINRVPQHRLQDVILLNPLDSEVFGLNIYDCPNLKDPTMVALTLDQVMDTFEKLYEMSRLTPRMAQVMRNVALTMIYNPGYTLIDVPLLLSMEKNHWFRRKLVEKALPAQKRFWNDYENASPADKRELTDSSRNKVDEFENHPLARTIFGQEHTTLNFRQLMDTGKIILAPLSNNYPTMSSLLGSILIGQILMAALSREDIHESKRRQFNLYVDEFQNYVTPAMNKLLTEARSYGIATLVAHQSRYQQGMTDAIRSTTTQARIIIIFSVNSADAKELAGEFDSTPDGQRVIPGDPTMFLTDYPNKYVQKFEQRFVRPFLQAKGEGDRHERREIDHGMNRGDYYMETIKPEYDFGGGVVEFNRLELRKAVNLLDRILFKTMLHEEVRDYELDDLYEMMAEFLNCSYAHYDLVSKNHLNDAYMLSDDGLQEQINEMKKKADLETDYDSAWPDWYRQMLRFGLFYSLFQSTRAALHNKPIYVTPATGDKPQSHTERQKEIENELVQMELLYGKGTARVRTPTGEYVITTEYKTPHWNDFDRKKDEIVRRTRSLYCHPRAEIEEQIIKRQTPPPTTTRTHIIES